MALTHKPATIAKAQVDFLEQRKIDLGLSVVFYGDQATFPSVPAACIEPAQVTRELSGFPYQTTNQFSTVILIYNTSLEGTKAIQEKCDLVSEAVAEALNAEGLPAPNGTGTLFGGLVISGMVARHEYGYRMLADKLMRCNRLVWSGMSKTPLLEA